MYIERVINFDSDNEGFKLERVFESALGRQICPVEWYGKSVLNRINTIRKGMEDWKKTRSWGTARARVWLECKDVVLSGRR